MTVTHALMIPLVRNSAVKLRLLFSSRDYCSAAANALPDPAYRKTRFDRPGPSLDPKGQSRFNSIVGRIRVGSSSDEVLESLRRDNECDFDVELSQNLVDKLLHRFKDDWKSALGVYRWAGSRSGYQHSQEAHDLMVDVLGKARQMDQMWGLLEELRPGNLVTFNTVGKAMRRFTGARRWEDAVRLFDELETYGLEKNTESMNLLLDTLCKEGEVVRARAIFLELKPHIPPDVSTFHIFIFGWCKAYRVEEAYWTLAEMRGNGYHPSVVSYSMIIQFYCRREKYDRVYDLLNVMESNGCPPNVVTYTTILCSLSKSQRFDEALEIAERVRRSGCKVDAFFYNALIHVLGNSGRVDDAEYVFQVEMPNAGVLPTTSTFNSMISMYCHHSQEQKALNILEKMESSTFCKPDGLTYFPLLKSCIRTGKIDCLLSQLLDDMVNKHHLSLDSSAYALLVHGLCRANRLEWAYRLFEEMLDQDIRPGHWTCQLLLEEVKLKHMYDAAEKIEDVIKVIYKELLMLRCSSDERL
ncbi:hypothetical protein Tsubulata_016867 [Turnera subulata]|uniref:Pentacotripeptide-repeat region of PRORP domain-containing protein n=1 Tax=Turnera subulata TaxID=218843 RepID=A0A9Q0FXK4_9ROSI|nr:hypothetical protein Tsubulata_016867 [Turnera subulata]